MFQIVPEDHLVRKIEAEIDFDFIYDMVNVSRTDSNSSMLFKSEKEKCFAYSFHTDKELNMNFYR